MSRNSSDPQPVSVRCHCGYRGEEKPVSFILDGRTFRVLRILDRRRVISPVGVLTEEYRVIVMTGREFQLAYHPRETSWTARALK